MDNCLIRAESEKKNLKGVVLVEERHEMGLRGGSFQSNEQTSIKA